MVLPDLAGTWVGTNGFRLLPQDPLAEHAATATVAAAAGGHLTSLAYAWRHPDDGPQDGLLVLWAIGGDGSLAALWGDSWHQQPAPMPLSGRRGPGGEAHVEGGYGEGWRWRIAVGPAADGRLRVRMDNVVPPAAADGTTPAGPYPVMLLHAHRR